MSKKTFITLLLIAQTIFTVGVVLSFIEMFGHNHPTLGHVGIIIMCFGSLCMLLVILFQKKLDKNNPEDSNS